MPLEDLGLLCLLEKVADNDTDMDAIAQRGLRRGELITADAVPDLTQRGIDRLDELRAWREEGEDADRQAAERASVGGNKKPRSG